MLFLNRLNHTPMRILSAVIILFFTLGAGAQVLNKDSLLLTGPSCIKAKKKVVLRLQNKSGMELQRLNPMAPLAVYKWNGKEWDAVPQIGYCGCGLIPCPPPPEMLPMNAGDVLEFEWDQNQSVCTDREKGTKEIKWSGRGKYKVVLDFNTGRNSETFQKEIVFRIR